MHPQEYNAISIFMLRRRKLRHRGVERLAQGYSASRWQRWDLNPDTQASSRAHACNWDSRWSLKGHRRGPVVKSAGHFLSAPPGGTLGWANSVSAQTPGILLPGQNPCVEEGSWHWVGVDWVAERALRSQRASERSTLVPSPFTVRT